MASKPKSSVVSLDPDREKLRLVLVEIFRSLLTDGPEEERAVRIMLQRLESNDLSASEWQELLSILAED